MQLIDNPPVTFVKKNYLGIGLKYYQSAAERFQLHIGILYFNDDANKPYLCHLPYDRKQANALATDDYKWISAAIDPEDSFAIISFCIAICNPENNEKGIPYGFSFREGLFDPNGAWQGDEGEGLTCATFVLAIMHQLKIPILRTEFWHKKAENDVAEDQQWKDFIVASYGPERGLEMRKGDNSPRFRPEEVACGANSGLRPLNYITAHTLGLKLLVKLHKKYVN